MAAMVLLCVALSLALQAGYGHAYLLRFLSARAHRSVAVDGRLQITVLSLHPHLLAKSVTIGNPRWMPAGTAATFVSISLVFETPRIGRVPDIETCVIEGATLRLIRDSEGRGNWQWVDPAQGRASGLPIVRSIAMRDAHLRFDDARRHLNFDGVVSVDDTNTAQGLGLMRVAGAGQLNGRTASFEITGDPLATANHHAPYHFSLLARSSGSQLQGRGALSQPFVVEAFDASFDAAGEDLQDLYFLTGVRLVNTGRYHLTGTLTRRAARFQFTDLAVSFGHSDVHGSVTIDSVSGRPVISADLRSQQLRLADLGARAAGRAPPSGDSTAWLLPSTPYSPAVIRRSDGIVNFHAARVDVGRVPLQTFAATASIDHGTLIVSPLAAEVLGGRLTGRIAIDARTDTPATDVDLKFDRMQLAQVNPHGSGQPPLEGLLRTRILIRGQGNSLHQIAASANGTVTAVLPHGTLRSPLAELTGIDLKGLGLLLTRSDQTVGVRCGIASFEAHDGILTSQRLMLDTDPVRIDGRGRINLESESVDLELRGHPKHAHFMRLRSPLLVQGSLLHPLIRIRARNSIGQAAEALGLGLALTPLAAVLAFVDPGLAQDADCAAAGASAANPTMSQHSK